MNTQKILAPTKKGFTLIELLMVIAIIGVLAAILIPAISSVRLKANSATSMSNLRQIGMAAITNLNENGGRFPSAYWGADDAWVKVLYKRIYDQPFADNGEPGAGLTNTVFWSPVLPSNPPTQRYAYGMNDYFRTFSGTKPVSNGDPVSSDGPLGLQLNFPAETCFIIDSSNSSQVQPKKVAFPNAGDTANVLFFDGHVEALTDEEVPDNWKDKGRTFWMGGPVQKP